MVDRPARNVAARILREFMEASITNEEYEKMYPTSKIDSSVLEIYIQIWFFYSDLREHKLTDTHALNVEQIAFFERSILFLRSDAEYEWPLQRFRPWQAFLRFLGQKNRIDEADSDGDESVWPFFDKTRYEEALKDVSD